MHFCSCINASAVLQLTEDLADRQCGVDDQFWVPESQAKAMFDNPVDKIVAATQQTLICIGGSCDYMLLVGGFSGSEYLIQKMRSAFSGSVRQRIVSPDYASAAVLQGCMMLCLGTSLTGACPCCVLEPHLQYCSARLLHAQM